MLYYSYKEKTKEYAGTGTAQPDPLESKKQGRHVFLLPANATFAAPPAEKDGFEIVWNGTAWEYVEDNRGTEYWLAGDTWQTPAREMKELGKLPDGAVLARPKKPLSVLRDEKKKEAEYALTVKLAEITPYYPTDEKVSFAKQEEEAKKYLADPEIGESEIPCIAGIAKGRQIALADLVRKIMYKANLFAAASGFYMGLKQRIEDLADRAQTEEEMAAIDVAEIFQAEFGEY